MSDRNQEFERALVEVIAAFAIPTLSGVQLCRLSQHYSLLCKWNRRINLTRLVEPLEAARLHYAESLFGGQLIGAARKVLDIGSGAGFPAVPIAVLRPDVHVTALEANQKKSLFLHEVKEELSLPNLTVAPARLEEFDWSDFDLLTSRALDRAESIIPSVIDRIGPGQRLMLFCSSDLLARISKRSARYLKPETRQVPQSDNRLVTIFVGV